MDGQEHCPDPELRPCPHRFGFPNCDATASDQKAGSSARNLKDLDLKFETQVVSRIHLCDFLSQQHDVERDGTLEGLFRNFVVYTRMC